MLSLNWKIKNVFSVLLGLLFLYLTLRIRSYNHSASVYLPRAPARDVWEYIADFSHMKYLNPTIKDFSIIKEGGNYDHWQYSVEYTENLSHWPHLQNNAIAHFSVKASKKQDLFKVDSIHKTCFFFNLLCLDSSSRFEITPKNNSQGAVCEETVTYECPSFLFWFCKREVEFQRSAIMRNLKKYFTPQI